MHFPKFWAKAAWNSEGTSREAWGWSDVSVDDARRVARERARAAASAGRHEKPGEYGYPDRPLREPVLRTLMDGTGGIRAVVTRNSQGCEVLNTDHAVFIDVDLPQLPARPKPSLFGALFGRPQPVQSDEQRVAIEAAVIARLDGWQRAHPAFSFRVYRTAAGLRYLLVSALLEPVDPLVVAAMDAAGADPDYRRLCRVQKSFRARLTPKPWRCGVERPPCRFPYGDTGQVASMEAWIAQYARVAERHASCFHLLDLGAAPTHPAIARILAEHDRLTRATSHLPLA